LNGEGGEERLVLGREGGREGGRKGGKEGGREGRREGRRDQVGESLLNGEGGEECSVLGREGGREGGQGLPTCGTSPIMCRVSASKSRPLDARPATIKEVHMKIF